MKFRFETLLQVHMNKENLLQKELGDILVHKQTQQNHHDFMQKKATHSCTSLMRLPGRARGVRCLTKDCSALLRAALFRSVACCEQKIMASKRHLLVAAILAIAVALRGW